MAAIDQGGGRGGVVLRVEAEKHTQGPPADLGVLAVEFLGDAGHGSGADLGQDLVCPGLVGEGGYERLHGRFTHGREGGVERRTELLVFASVEPGLEEKVHRLRPRLYRLEGRLPDGVGRFRIAGEGGCLHQFGEGLGGLSEPRQRADAV